MENDSTEQPSGNGGAADGVSVGIGTPENTNGGSDGGGFGTHFVIDPGKVGSTFGGNDNNGDTQPRRRGRPRGSKNAGSAKKTQNIDINGVAAAIYSLHLMAATFTKSPRLAVTEEEAKALSEASQKVARHYDYAISEKSMDWMNLWGTLGMVYGSRIFAASRERAEKRAEQQATRAANGADGETIIPGTFAAQTDMAGARGFN